VLVAPGLLPHDCSGLLTAMPELLLLAIPMLALRRPLKARPASPAAAAAAAAPAATLPPSLAEPAAAPAVAPPPASCIASSFPADGGDAGERCGSCARLLTLPQEDSYSQLLPRASISAHCVNVALSLLLLPPHSETDASSGELLDAAPAATAARDS